ncbi:endonuclease/exonuclease/phosphatase family protein [Porphyromonas macacae]|uniref:endonuclease/exonuclease/phosphatase family protein n=1 Tax=Porphyromonas macacae TaxID=28115 RepID=UPI00126A0E63|nr:endonuclease/exonuclease/phosphatase family protein [Porphyromonas macacae]
MKKTIRRYTGILLLTMGVFPLSCAQNHSADTCRKEGTLFRVMCYNVENLFDLEDDPEKDDEDFLPEGKMNWTKTRYNRKINQIGKVISRAGQWDWPAIVGLTEVESDLALKDLVSTSILRNQGYKYMITDSPDKRGVDVALLYLPEYFKPVRRNEFTVHFSTDPEKRSRNILYVSGQLPNGNLLHVMVCHLPSRREGARETAIFRRETAAVMRRMCDSLAKNDNDANILIMGDFNGNPQEAATTHELRAGLLLPKHAPEKIRSYPPQLYNLFGEHETANPSGSYVYKGRWTQLDQMIISESLLLKNGTMSYVPGSAHTMYEKFLLHFYDDGIRDPVPERTYIGPVYKGGYSDHLPIVADFLVMP